MFKVLQRSATLALSITILLCSSPTTAQEPNVNDLKKQAITIVKQFGGTLKPLLRKALNEGGVKEAIEVCSVKAPGIASELSLSTKWQVKRVSLKSRNSHSAIPDTWGNKALNEFNQRQQQGEKAKTMAKAEIVNDEFRFMKAQGVEPLCLSCHGSELSSEAKDALKQHYPNDKATGYSLGEIRGAFSLTKKL
jgi:hypothetical protein